MKVRSLLKKALKAVGQPPETKVTLSHHSKIIIADCYGTSIQACGLRSNDTLSISGSMLGGMIAPEKQDGDDIMNQSSQEMQILIEKDDQAALFDKSSNADGGTV